MSGINDWIDLTALGQIVGIGLLCGAGLPAVFAVGLKVLSLDAGRGTAGSEDAVTRNPALLAAAGLCFAVVLAAIGAGIYLIVAGT